MSSASQHKTMYNAFFASFWLFFLSRVFTVTIFHVIFDFILVCLLPKSLKMNYLVNPRNPLTLVAVVGCGQEAMQSVLQGSGLMPAPDGTECNMACKIENELKMARKWLP